MRKSFFLIRITPSRKGVADRPPSVTAPRGHRGVLVSIITDFDRNRKTEAKDRSLTFSVLFLWLDNEENNGYTEDTKRHCRQTVNPLEVL